MNKLQPGKILLLAFIYFIVSAQPENTFAQNNSQEGFISDATLGFGFGLDYGGIGVRLTGSPSQRLGLFLSGGYNFNNLGYNFGAQFRFNPKDRTCLYYTLMYGYNAVIVIKNGDQYNKTFYGVSTGLGLEFHSKKRGQDFWNLELLIPIRSDDFRTYIDDLRKKPYISGLDDPIPVAISVGYHFPL